MKSKIPAACHLCNSHGESRGLFFFNCPYSRAILLPLAEIRNHSSTTPQPIPSLASPDIRLGDLAEAYQKFTLHTQLGLLWNSFGTLAWHIRIERNKRLKQHTLRSPATVLKEVIRDIKLSFRPECQKKNCYLPIEIATL